MAARSHNPLMDLARFHQAFDAHRPRLERILQNRVRGTPQQHAYDEILQQTHIKAWERWPDYSAKEPLIDAFVWLYGIMRDCWIDKIRYDTRNGRHLQNVPISAETSFQIAAHLTSGTGTPSAKVMRDEMINIVRRAIEMLPEADRLVIEMHDDDTLTFREIAVKSGETEDAVRKRYVRARDKKLKALLEKMLGEYRP